MALLGLGYTLAASSFFVVGADKQAMALIALGAMNALWTIAGRLGKDA